jgi:peptidoglycan/xylan/chitin deacetylase (PgdA/CDA1 family)
MEWEAPPGSFTSSLAGGLGDRPFPDYARVSHREYGHRVGIFRVLDVLEKHGIRPTVAIDAMTAEANPYLVAHCRQRGAEIIGHGISVSRMITGRMTEEDEEEYVNSSVEALRRAADVSPQGWLGPEHGESERTPGILAAAGISYVCDWVNDERPYRMTTAQGELHALPLMLELDDVNALWDRKVPVDRYARLLEESFDGLYEESQESGLLMAFNLHPWLIGQPFRIGYLDQALGHMVRRQGVWAATGSEITEWFKANPPG